MAKDKMANKILEKINVKQKALSTEDSSRFTAALAASIRKS